jgi:SAM-dependent methyltransferase
LLVNRFLRTVQDLGRKPIAEMRVLDLACLEGAYAIEFARQGAAVVGTEGREVNVAKAEFARRALNLERCEFVLDDVRNLGREKYGLFDVVLCIGIFYHLDAPDIFKFMKAMGEVCTNLLVIDTNISLSSQETREFEGRTYWGANFTEHAPTATAPEKLKNLWASLDNPTSFWLTRPSLYNLLIDTGFTSVYEVHMPPNYGPPHRLTLVAVKGGPLTLKSTPPSLAEQEFRYPEDHQWTHEWAKEANAATPGRGGLGQALLRGLGKKMKKIFPRG